MKKDVLLLNASEEVISVIDWMKAVKLLMAGKATKPYNYEDYHEITTSSGMFKLPTAIVLVQYVRIPYRKCKLSKKNLFNRDNGMCQYCSKKLTKASFTIDHVLPKSRGGKNTWENMVACCRNCNVKKKNRTPNEANMKLLSTPGLPHKDFVLIKVYDGNHIKLWERWISINNK
jgi:5-methylcytosine-specific restriction endonuclease McrA